MCFQSLAGLAAFVVVFVPVCSSWSAEPSKVSEACPPYQFDGAQNCPAPETLARITCPEKWPRDEKAGLAYGTPYPIARLNGRQPDWTREDFERETAGFYLDCQYGPLNGKHADRKHLTIVVPVPVVQYIFREKQGGKEIGFLVFKDEAPSSPEILFPETVTPATTLAGFGLGWRPATLDAFVRRNGYARAPGSSEGIFIFFKPGSVVEVTIDPIADETSAVVLRATGGREVEALRRQAVRRFGFNWSGVFGAGEQDDLEKLWEPSTRKVAVEFWRRGDPNVASQDSTASLRLVKTK